jgi:septal ring factor EnvC (AmiA/AmiB activator)
MTRTSLNATLLFCVLAIASCGTSKKLEQTTAALNALEATSNQQTDSIAKSEMQIVQQEAAIGQLKKETYNMEQQKGIAGKH